MVLNNNPSPNNNYSLYFAENVDAMDNIPDINYAEEITNLNNEFRNRIDKLDNNKYSPILSQLKLTLPTVQEQYNTKQNISSNLKILEQKYRFLSDYIDMVHDFKICFDYFKDIIPSNDIQELNILIQKICSSNLNIQVQKSYKEQFNLFKQYINDLKERGFTIPELPEYQIITEENINSLHNIKTFYRESGRGLDSFYQKTGQQNGIPTALITNAVGAIDGCGTKCDLLAMTERIIWQQNVAGVFDITLTTNVCGKSCSEIQITNASNIKQPIKVIFNVKGEIVLDDVIDYLPDNISNKALRNVNHDSNLNNITLIRVNINNQNYNDMQIQDINKNKKNSKYMNNILRLCFMVLKTVCDKTVVQRIKNPKEIIDAVCTIDSYVFAVPLLEYLSGNIKYCPTVLISKEYGYDKFSFQDIGNNNELLNHIIYFISFVQSSLFKGDANIISNMPLFTNGMNDSVIHEMVTNINKLILFTDKFVTNAKNKFKDYPCNDLWGYIKTVSIASYYDDWEYKKQVINDKLNKVISLLVNYNPSKEELKTQLINSLLDIPVIIPSISDLIIELEEQSDDFVPISIDEMESYVYEKLFEKVLINNLEKNNMSKENIKQFLDNYLSVIHNCQLQLSNCNKNDLNLIQQTNEETSNILETAKANNSILQLIQTYKIKINPLDINDIIKISTSKIQDDYIKIYINQTNPNYERILSKFIQEYNENNEKSIGKGIEYKYEYILLPITAELLINISKQYYIMNNKKRSRSDDTNDFYNEASSRLFDIIKGFLHLTDSKKKSFQEFFIKALQNEGECNLEKLWNDMNLNDYWNDDKQPNQMEVVQPNFADRRIVKSKRPIPPQTISNMNPNAQQRPTPMDKINNIDTNTKRIKRSNYGIGGKKRRTNKLKKSKRKTHKLKKSKRKMSLYKKTKKQT